MSGRGGRVVGGALAVTAGLVVAAGGTAFVGPPDAVVEEHPERVAPVVRSTSVCPYAGGEPSASSRLGVLALPDVAEPREPASPDDPAATEPDDPAATEEEEAEQDDVVTVRRLAGPDEEPDAFLTVTDRGIPASKKVGGDEPAAYDVRAEGTMAPGVAAEQYTLVQRPDLRGVLTAACTGPAREHWFVGAESAVGQRGRLVLANPSDTPAVVTVSLWDEAGVVEAAGTKDISIPARSSDVLLLDALAEDRERLAVQVLASRGRVAAAVEYRESDEGEPRGMTMVPAAAAPSKSLVVPGVPGHGERTLRIVAPGDTDAIVSIRVLGTAGPFSPLDHDVVTVPAGTVLDLPMDEVLGDSAAAIELESDEDITAAVRVVTGGSDELPDLAYTAATPPLPAEPAAAVLSRDSSGMSSRLLLTAVGDMGGRATLTTVDLEGNVVDEQEVELSAGTTAVAELESGDETVWAYTFVEAAAPGTVVAVREIQGSDDDGALLDLAPLVAPPAMVQVPTVVGELPTGLRPTSTPSS